MDNFSIHTQLENYKSYELVMTFLGNLSYGDCLTVQKSKT